MLGLDFGACELKIAQIESSRIKRLVTVPMPDNMVHDGVIVSYDAMGDFLKETLKTNKISGGNAAVILPGSLVYLRRLTIPAMTEEQLQVNLPYEFRDFLSESKDKYFYDYAVNSLREEPGDEEDDVHQVLDLTAAAVAKSTIEVYRDMLRRAGLKLATAIPVECAYSNVIRTFGKADIKEYAFLDLGHTSTRLSIYTGDVFETFRTVDMGLSKLDTLISEDFSVDIHVARMYKQTDHLDCQTKENAKNLYGEITAEIRKAINFYSFNNRESQLQDLFLCGGGVHIPAYWKTMEENLEIKLHKASEFIEGADDTEEDEDSFFGAIGAALQ